MALQIRNGSITIAPDPFFIHACIGQTLGTKYLWMNAGDQNLLVIGAIEYADLPEFGQLAGRTSQKIVLQFLRAGMFEAGDAAALGIDTRHDMGDGSIFTGSIHGLKNHQKRKATGRIQQLLLRTQLFDVRAQFVAILAIAPV